MRNMRMNKSGVTGRDAYILAKALAYAISIIDALPQERQEWSDREDMACLLDALGANHHLSGARKHLGFEVLFYDPKFEADSLRAMIRNLARLLSVNVRFDH
jgi:hypothetical protein